MLLCFLFSFIFGNVQNYIGKDIFIRPALNLGLHLSNINDKIIFAPQNILGTDIVVITTVEEDGKTLYEFHVGGVTMCTENSTNIIKCSENKKKRWIIEGSDMDDNLFYIKHVSNSLFRNWFNSPSKCLTYGNDYKLSLDKCDKDAGNQRFSFSVYVIDSNVENSKKIEDPIELAGFTLDDVKMINNQEEMILGNDDLTQLLKKLNICRTDLQKCTLNLSKKDKNDSISLKERLLPFNLANLNSSTCDLRGVNDLLKGCEKELEECKNRVTTFKDAECAKSCGKSKIDEPIQPKELPTLNSEPKTCLNQTIPVQETTKPVQLKAAKGVSVPIKVVAEKNQKIGLRSVNSGLVKKVNPQISPKLVSDKVLSYSNNNKLVENRMQSNIKPMNYVVYQQPTRQVVYQELNPVNA